jgi:hypothetical protein
MRFQHPSNGYIEECASPWLWTLLFGFFYFAYKGIWGHALLGAIVGLCSAGLSWCIYPFFARGIIRAAYVRAGWQELPGAPATLRDAWNSLNSPARTSEDHGRHTGNGSQPT